MWSNSDCFGLCSNSYFCFLSLTILLTSNTGLAHLIRTRSGHQLSLYSLSSEVIMLTSVAVCLRTEKVLIASAPPKVGRTSYARDWPVSHRLIDDRPRISVSLFPQALSSLAKSPCLRHCRRLAS